LMYTVTHHSSLLSHKLIKQDLCVFHPTGIMLLLLLCEVHCYTPQLTVITQADQARLVRISPHWDHVVAAAMQLLPVVVAMLTFLPTTNLLVDPDLTR